MIDLLLMPLWAVFVVCLAVVISAAYGGVTGWREHEGVHGVDRS